MIYMKSKKVLFASCLVSMCGVVHAEAASTVTYKNQRGSVLVLEWHAQDKDTGTLSGTFSTAVGDCSQDMNVPVPISGFYNGNAIALSVNFPHCEQVVAMTGNTTKDKTRINTLWLDAHIAKEPMRADWNSNLIGSDFYKKEE